NQSQPSQTVITSTSISTFVTLGSDRQASTATSTFIFTTTQVLTPAPLPSGNGTGNGTVSGNNTLSANTTTTPRNLPTAPASVDGGGGSNGAPLPGQTGNGGIYGPDDNYTAAATALKHNAFVVGFVGLALGGAMLAF
ncbi:hypothetical protein AN958_05001, partial [Leucoagaricus sp. SymC.cos]